MFLPLPQSLDPRVSLEARERYIKFIVPLWMFLCSTMTSSYYGFNVWILPITIHHFGSDATYTMETGQILYAFSLPTLIAAMIMPLGSQILAKGKIPVRYVTLIGVVLYCCGLILGGLAVQYNRLWLLWIGIGLFSGIGSGLLFLPIAIYSVAWFREIGQPGMGSGLAGFTCGLWPALFSFYCPVLIDQTSVQDSFYWNALIILVITIPGILLQCSPTEVPLQRNDNTDEISMKNDGDDHDGGEQDGTTSVSNKGEEIETAAQTEVDTDVHQETPLTMTAILSYRQFYIQFLGTFLCLFPGFAIKYNISILASALFQTTQQTESIISFIFLFTYATVRLFIGIGVGRWFSADIAAQGSAAIQILGLIGAALVVFLGAKYLWIFVICEVIVGMGLAAYKVTVSLGALARWSMLNFSSVTTLFFLAYGLAGFIGPILGWMMLVLPGDVPLNNELAEEKLGSATTKETTEMIAGVVYFAFGFCALLGFLVVRYAVAVVFKNDENV